MRADNETPSYRDSNRASTLLVVWTIAWTASLALAVFGPTLLWDSRTLASWTAIAINVAIGAGLIVAHARYLQAIDELQRKINLDALAVTLGVGFVGGFAYIAVDNADLIDSDAHVGFLSMVLAVVYMTAIVAGNLRYR